MWQWSRIQVILVFIHLFPWQQFLVEIINSQMISQGPFFMSLEIGLLDLNLGKGLRLFYFLGIRIVLILDLHQICVSSFCYHSFFLQQYRKHLHQIWQLHLLRQLLFKLIGMRYLMDLEEVFKFLNLYRFLRSDGSEFDFPMRPSVVKMVKRLSWVNTQK